MTFPPVNEDAVRVLLKTVGEDPTREGLRDTPARYVRALREMCRGYDQDPATILKAFGDGADGYDEMVIVRDATFYSLCEHHLVPFFGTATMAYIPNGRVVGLSKLVRLLDCFSRRLQVQERLTAQLADAMHTHLQTKGVGVIVRARHLCMECRGVNRPGTETVTSALRGALLEHGPARAELMSLSAQG